MEIGFKKEFDKCPNCGSKERFCEEISKAAVKKGLSQADWNLYFDKRDGAAFNMKNIVLMPANGIVPAYSIRTDICLDCGTIYARDVSIGAGKLGKPGAPMGQMDGDFPFSTS